MPNYENKMRAAHNRASARQEEEAKLTNEERRARNKKRHNNNLAREENISGLSASAKRVASKKAENNASNRGSVASDPGSPSSVGSTRSKLSWKPKGGSRRTRKGRKGTRRH